MRRPSPGPPLTWVLLPPALASPQRGRAVPGRGISLSGPPCALGPRRPGPAWPLAPTPTPQLGLRGDSRPPPRDCLPQRRPPGRACQACGAAGSCSTDSPPVCAPRRKLRKKVFLGPARGSRGWGAGRPREFGASSGMSAASTSLLEPAPRFLWAGEADCGPPRSPASSWQAVWGHGKLARGPATALTGPRVEQQRPRGAGAGGPTGRDGQWECPAWPGPVWLQLGPLPEDSLYTGRGCGSAHLSAC